MIRIVKVVETSPTGVEAEDKVHYQVSLPPFSNAEELIAYLNNLFPDGWDAKWDVRVVS